MKKTAVQHLDGCNSQDLWDALSAMAVNETEIAVERQIEWVEGGGKEKRSDEAGPRSKG